MKQHSRALLVTGGAGYIGSHMLAELHRTGWQSIVLDRVSAKQAPAARFAAHWYSGEVGDETLLQHIFSSHAIAGVLHFAAHIQVAESVAKPGDYYANNVAQTLQLLRSMAQHGVSPLIFSSTAAVYGIPNTPLIAEDHPIQPINPYGRGKAMAEQMLADFHAAHGLRFGCLRYFNAAGADIANGLGECHEPETHLIPLVLRVASGRAPHITLFGQDYPTPDGSCIRDYIHVKDLASAHLRLLEYLLAGGEDAHFNLGTGHGHSVRAVVETARSVTHHPIPAEWQPRRAGDPPQLVADATRAHTILGWQPQHSDLTTIIRDAWAWEQHLASRS